jgi:WD40 repeat protein
MDLTLVEWLFSMTLLRGAVTSLAIRRGTGQMFSVSSDRTLKVWSLDDMAYVDTLFGQGLTLLSQHDQFCSGHCTGMTVTAALIIPFGDLNYCVDSTQLKRYEPHMSPRHHAILPAQLEGAYAASFKRQLSATGSSVYGLILRHQSDVMAVAPQRKERVVTVGRDRTCRFWKVAEDSQLIFR